jgi:hypothetical protein
MKPTNYVSALPIPIRTSDHAALVAAIRNGKIEAHSE